MHHSILAQQFACDNEDAFLMLVADKIISMENRRKEGCIGQTDTRSSWSSVPDSWVILLVHNRLWTKTCSAKFRMVCVNWCSKHDGILTFLKLHGDLERVGSFLQKFPCLKVLEMCNAKNFSANQYNVITTIQMIRVLDLSRTWQDIESNPQDVNNEVMMKLSEVSCVSSLHTLSLRNCVSISDRGVRSMHRYDKLTSLDLTNCQKLTDTGMHSLGKVSALQKLQLNCCSNVSHYGLRALSRLSLLKTLFMGCCRNVTTNSLKEIARIPSLRVLVLESCAGVTDEGLEAVRSLVSLRSLNIASCVCISDKGMKVLSTFPKLRHLDVSYCYGITDQGIEAIASSTTLTSLQLLKCNLVSDAGLLPLTRMPFLRRLVPPRR